MKEEKKRKALISSLQQQKKITMQEMRAEITEINKQIDELYRLNEPWTTL